MRHAEPAINRGLPASRWPLSADGRASCQPLAEALSGYAPAHVASSREPKAMETARLVAAALEIEWTAHDGLEEHHRESVPFLGNFRTRVADFFARPDQRVLGEESAAECLERFSAAVDAVLAGWSWRRPAIIVTHGTTMSLLAARRTGREPMAIWDSLRLPCLLLLDD